MKIHLVLFILFCSVGAFGQSKKKLNLQLSAEYVVIDKEVDSLINIIPEKEKILRKQRIELKQKFEEVSDGRQKYGFYYLEVLRLYTSLKTLEKADLSRIDPKLVEGLRFVKIPDTSIANSVKVKPPALMWFNKKLLVIPEHAKVDEKNQILEEMIRTRINEKNALNDVMKSLNEQSGELFLSNMGLDDIAERLLNLTPIIVNLERDIEIELSRQRKLFTENGPKGFSENYHIVFPWVFNPSIEEEIAPQQAYPEFISRNYWKYLGDKEPEAPSSPEILDLLEVNPEFPGGQAALKKYLKDNLKLPEKVVLGEVSGKVYLRFVVSETGNISNITVKKGVPGCPECDEEAFRVVRSMPNWVPGKNNEKPVNSWFTLPINFVAQ